MVRAGLLSLFLAVTASFAMASRADAHGRFPRTGQLAFHPSDPDTIVVRATFGLTISRDGGDSWQWICQDALDATLNEDPAITIMGDGAITAAVFQGLLRTDDGGCEWSYPTEALQGVVAIDQVRHPDDPAAAFVVTSSGGTENRVWATEDHGLAWAETGETFPTGALPESIAVAPSDGQRLYVGGIVPETAETPREIFLQRSSDGGESWEQFAFALREFERNVRIVGVDPSEPDRLFVRVVRDADAAPDQNERLVVSEDGGESWSDMFELPYILSFTVSLDGNTIWVGGTEQSGLWRSTDSGDSFEPIQEDMSVNCLEHRGEMLWACAENFSDGFAVGRSSDGGENFEPIMVFDDIEGVLDCPAEAPTTSMCIPEYEDLERDLGLEGPGGDAGATDGGAADGGGGSGGGSGCSCRANGFDGARSNAPRALAWLLAAGTVVAQRRRRRRAHRRP